METRITAIEAQAPQGPLRAGILAVLPAAMLACAGLAGLVAHTLLRGGASGQYLILVRPDLPQGMIIDKVHRAGGGVLAFGWLPGVAVTLSDDPDFPDRMRRDGAWGVVAAPGNLGCAAEARGDKP